jgi:hypothetical protein
MHEEKVLSFLKYTPKLQWGVHLATQDAHLMPKKLSSIGRNFFMELGVGKNMFKYVSILASAQKNWIVDSFTKLNQKQMRLPL